MLNFDDLTTGDRIVVRYRLDDAPPGTPGSSDALGPLVQISPTHVIIETRKGEVRVERAAITHAKRVPPAPARRARAARNM